MSRPPRRSGVHRPERRARRHRGGVPLRRRAKEAHHRDRCGRDVTGVRAQRRGAQSGRFAATSSPTSSKARSARPRLRSKLSAGSRGTSRRTSEYPDRQITKATGTPVSNTVAALWVAIRYLGVARSPTALLRDPAARLFVHFAVTLITSIRLVTSITSITFF